MASVEEVGPLVADHRVVVLAWILVVPSFAVEGVAFVPEGWVLAFLVVSCMAVWVLLVSVVRTVLSFGCFLAGSSSVVVE